MSFMHDITFALHNIIHFQCEDVVVLRRRREESPDVPVPEFAPVCPRMGAERGRMRLVVLLPGPMGGDARGQRQERQSSLEERPGY